MKKSFFRIALGALLLGSIAFTAATYDVRNSTAEVEQEGGVLVFYRSKPVKDYQHLGTYKITFAMNGKPETLFDKLIKKAKEKYPDADAVIISNDLEKCDAVKFK